jgi:hypothetical protein
MMAGALLLALGLLLYQSPHWGRYGPDCSYPLLQASQSVAGLMAALAGYRVFRAIRAT